jgi:hypothetical protein
MFFVFCLLCFFWPKRKKRASICRKEQREKKVVHTRGASKEKAKTYKNKVDRASEEAHDAHTRARAHIVIIKIERTTRNNKHHGTRFRRSIRKRTGTSSILFFST